MATVIKIKTSGSNTTPSNPSLATGELAYTYLTGNQSNGGDRLYIGTGTETDGEAANMVPIGGKYFTDMLDHVHGTLTADSAIITDSNSKIDVLNVDNITIDGNTVSSTDANGNIVLDPNGTGSIVLDGPVSMTGDFGLTGDMTVTNLDVTTEATLGSAVIEDLTDNRILISGTGGAVEDDSNLTFDGTTFKVGTDSTDKFTVAVNSGNTAIAGTLGVTGESTLASATVSDLTDNEIVIAGTAGSLETDSNFTFDGTTFKVGTDSTDKFTVAVGTGNTAIAGTLGVTGESTLASATVSDLTSGRVVLAGTSGSLVDTDKLTYGIISNTLTMTVTGNLDVVGTFDADQVNIDGNTIQSNQANGDLNISQNGTGSVNIGNIKFVTDKIYTETGNSITIDPNAAGASGTVIIEGDLVVNGVSTTVNSTTVTIDDAIFTLGGDQALTSQDGLDKGISFQWYDTDATSAKEGFFGWELTDQRFKFIPDATVADSVVSGTVGDVEFANALLDSVTFSATNFPANNGVLFVDTSGDVGFVTEDLTNVYNPLDVNLDPITTGQILQLDSSGVPFFGYIDCGTY